MAETQNVTGARFSEVLGARRDQVKKSGTVEIRLYGKGGKERTSRIPAEFYRRILEELPEGTYLFERAARDSASTVSTS